MGSVVTTCDEGLLLAVYSLECVSVSLREDTDRSNKLSSAPMSIIPREAE
jgi:hypothetical protein